MTKLEISEIKEISKALNQFQGQWVEYRKYDDEKWHEHKQYVAQKFEEVHKKFDDGQHGDRIDFDKIINRQGEFDKRISSLEGTKKWIMNAIKGAAGFIGAGATFLASMWDSILEWVKHTLLT
jgi:hypothetical protein